MERLSKQAQDNIRKTSTIRLQTNLINAGADEQDVAALDRQQLMETWAQKVAEGKDKPVAAVPEAKAPVGYDPEVERERLKWEQDRFNREMELKKEMEAEKMKFEREKEDERKKEEENKMKLEEERLRIEAEKVRVEEEKLKMKAEKEDEKIGVERAALIFRKEKEADEAAKLKKYSEALRGVIPKQTNDPLEVVAFFRNVERLFQEFKVPVELRGTLIRPFLTERAKTLVAKMEPSQATYSKIKEMLLREYKVSAPLYRERFNEIEKKDDETYVMFSSSLSILIDGYIEARRVTRLNELRDLIISDRIKMSLKPAILRYVLSVEAKSESGWLSPFDLAELVDDYLANYSVGNMPKSGVLGMVDSSVKPKGQLGGQGGRQMGTGTKFTGPNPPSPPTKFAPRQKPEAGAVGGRKPLTCFRCGGNHLVRFCTKPGNGNSNRSVTESGRVNQTFIQNSRPKHFSNSVNDRGARPTDAGQQSSQGVEIGHVVHSACVTANVVATPSQTADRVDEKIGRICDIKRTAVNIHDQLGCLIDVKHPLNYLQVNVSSPMSSTSYTSVLALRDSGSECVLISGHIFRQLSPVEIVGEVKISGIYGDPVPCQLTRLKLTPVGGKESVIVTAAVFDNLHDDMVLPSAILQRLDEIIAGQSSDDPVSDGQTDNLLVSEIEDASVVENDCEVNVITRSGFSTSNSTNDRSNQPDNADDDVVDTDVLVPNLGYDVGNDEEAERQDGLSKEQEDDPSLRHSWSLLKRGKGNFYLQGKILMRQEKILGQTYSQLVVPMSRRRECLEFGHDLAGHMSPKKVSQRIRLSFWWPSMKGDIINHVKTCQECQLHGRKTCWDRVPIHAVQRHEKPFMHWHMDVLGPMSSEKLTYPYCLVLLDSYSRFPAAYPLKAPTAKNICDCLINLWSFVGVPQYVSLDNASYNISGLTQELFKRFAVTPKFITPYHSEGNAAAERLIGTTKRLVAKVASQNPNTWHKHLPFVLWAIREVPSDLTGVPPWLLAMGTIPRGPLTVLRESWMGTGDLPPKLGKAPEQYLRELHQNLEVAKHYAEAHTKRMQQVYVERYNKRSRDKSFDPGDSVLILHPKSSSSRTFSTWKGPATVLERLSPHSYLVDLDGAKYRLHANHLKHFFTAVNEVRIDSFGFGNPNSLDNGDWTSVNTSLDEDGIEAQVATCAVVRDEDADFGDIKSCMSPELSTQLPSQRIEPSVVAHLSESEKQQLLALLDKYAVIFRDEPGLYPGVKHQIPLTNDFKPRRMKEHKIPEKIKPEVLKQIKDLLDQGIIRPSTTPMASPLVCLLKGPSGRDGIRLAVDFRFLNRYTISDAFPIGDIEEIIQKVGNSTCNSVLDCAAGYYQTYVCEEDRWKTGFICDDQLYEWIRTPFGLKSSGQTFCRAAQQVLQPVKDIAAAWIDDIIVHSNGFSQHLIDLERFFKVILNAGMTLKLKKCRFALSEVKYCGQILGSGKRRPDPEKLAAIDAIKLPETKKQVRQLLGFFNYFRDSIPSFAEIAKPLTDLTKKSRAGKIHCDAREAEAISKLKLALCEAVETPRFIIDPGKDYSLLVDAAQETVACALTQPSDDDKERPIAFFSWKLNETQRNWATVEKEAYAALRALQRVKQWVFGCKVTVFSDHNPLTYLTESAPKSSKLLRWSLALQEFDIEFKYRAGQLNVVPDLLTRMCQHDDV